MSAAYDEYVRGAALNAVRQAAERAAEAGEEFVCRICGRPDGIDLSSRCPEHRMDGADGAN